MSSATLALLNKNARTAILNKLTEDEDSSKNLKTIVLIIGSGLLIPALITIFIGSLAIFAVINSYHSDISKLGGEPTTVAVREIGENILLFRQAQSKYEVSWAVLAGIAKIESGFGKGDYYVSRKGVSEAGAVGYMQFMPLTWSGWSNPYARNDPNWQPLEFSPSPDTLGLPYDTDPSRIGEYGGYGVDGDGDGYADPYNPIDAIFSAAKYIKANLGDGNYENALFCYNHSKQYVTDVLKYAEVYQEYQLPNTDGLWPLAQYYDITATFKQVKSKDGKTVLWPEGHSGIDIGCPEGTPLYAIIPGRIEFAGFASRAGGMITIDDLNGTQVSYCHLSESIVTQGDYIEQGDLIGYSGNTGRSTGPHLHLTLRVNGQLSNPLDWLTPLGEPDFQNY